MRVLLTNDDGLHAPGIRALAESAVAAGHDVVAVAPEGDWSGSGTAVGNLGEDTGIRYRQVTFFELESVHAIELNAAPALCVIAAGLGAFGDPPDLVLSGVNPGLNTGRATMHSGTVGAALTGAGFGLPAVAVSIAGHESEVVNWRVAGDLAVRTGEWLAVQHASNDSTTAEGSANGLQPGPMVNLSVPDRPMDKLREPVVGPLARFGSVRTKILNKTEDRIHLGFIPSTDGLDEGSDTMLAERGHVVITPLVRVNAGDPSSVSGLAESLSSALDGTH
jgi:5'-nucleotidase